MLEVELTLDCVDGGLKVGDDCDESVCSECQSMCGSQCTCSEASMKMSVAPLTVVNLLTIEIVS